MTPTTEQDIAHMIAAATGPLHITGGGTRPVGRPQSGTPLTTAGLSGITLYDPGALTIVAQSGTPLAKIEAALAAENQRLAFEPMDHRPLLGTTGTPTIGGVVASNTSGPRRIAVGACRDFMLGVRFVDGQGQIIKNGGRVMKNVTGYDLVKLMSGAHGTLGVLTEVALKTLPNVESTATLTLTGLSTAEAIKAMSHALGAPYDVTGAAHLAASGRTMLRIEGFEGSVAYRAEKLAQHLSQFGSADIAFNTPEDWHAIRDVTGLAAQKGDIWRISVRPSEAAKVAGALGAKDLQFDWGGGLIWALMDAGTDARAALGNTAGHATLIRASDATKQAIAPFHPETAPLAKISQGLRARFDPRGILNPGLMT